VQRGCSPKWQDRRGPPLRPIVREKYRAHDGAGRREQAHAALHTVVPCSLDQIRKLKGVEFVNLHVAAELDVPTKSFLK